MRKAGNNHTIDVVFVLTLACLFAASILMVLMLGANIYGNIQETSEAQFSEKVSLSYIKTKVHSNDIAGGVRTGEFGGVSALYLDSEIDGETFSTIIYSYNGWLKELFASKEDALEEDSWLLPELGMPLIEMNHVLHFHFLKPNLLSVEYTDVCGSGGQMFINLRSERDGGL